MNMTDTTSPTPASNDAPLRAKVLTVSDGVVHGTREDTSGAGLAACLERHGFEVVERALTADGVENVAEAMRSISPMGRLSRGVVGIRGASIICNTPGSPKGCVEQIEAIIDVLPHALRLLDDRPTHH